MRSIGKRTMLIMALWLAAAASAWSQTPAPAASAPEAAAPPVTAPAPAPVVAAPVAAAPAAAPASAPAAPPALKRPGLVPVESLNAADTAWMMTSTALVLLMTLPGIALFYAGMVRKKSLLGTMAQSVAATAIVSILWFGFGYSLVFSGDGALIGDFARLFGHGIAPTTTLAAAPTIPELLFMAYQMTFAVITCALVAGAVADRMNFAAFLVFCVVWLFPLVWTVFQSLRPYADSAASSLLDDFHITKK